jgi:hypothetical protein
MKDVRVDTAGELRCWNCGSASFREKRTMRSKVIVGVGALVTKKKLKCNVCGEYNDVGSAKPYKGPASKRLGKKLGTLTNMHGQDVPDGDEPGGDVAAPPPPPPAAAAVPAGWHPDPHGVHELRYWDGTSWTEHVSDAGVTAVDAP